MHRLELAQSHAEAAVPNAATGRETRRGRAASLPLEGAASLHILRAVRRLSPMHSRLRASIQAYVIANGQLTPSLQNMHWRVACADEQVRYGRSLSVYMTLQSDSKRLGPTDAR